MLSSFLSLAVQSEEKHVKTSSANTSYGVSTLIPEWTPDLGKEDTKLKAQNGDFIAVPIPVVDPTVGSGIVAVGAYYYVQTAEQKLVQPASATQLVGAYTNNDSYAYGLMQKNYWDEDSWRFVGTAAYTALKLTLIDSQYTENGSQLDWNIKGTLLKSELLRSVGSNWYMGGQVRLINNTQTFSGNIEGEFSLSSEEEDQAKAYGLGILVQYDTRDSQTNAYKGQRFELDALFNSKEIGSTNSYQSYNLKYRYYHQLIDSLVLSVEAKGCAKSGQAPLWDYCTIGLRGFSATRYINKVSTSLQSELRWRAWKDIGAVAFIGLGYNGKSISELDDKASVNSYGVGLRYMVLDSQRINLRFDYARSGDSDAIYISVAEAF